MRDLAAQGYAILFFSTDIQELVHVADRVAVLADGRVSALLGGDAITEEAIIRASIAYAEAA
jgi:ribose transport system ATP-binding protein